MQSVEILVFHFIPNIRTAVCFKWFFLHIDSPFLQEMEISEKLLKNCSVSLLGNNESICLECIDSCLDDGHEGDFILNF